jgi:hypothetical protein
VVVSLPSPLDDDGGMMMGDDDGAMGLLSTQSSRSDQSTATTGKPQNFASVKIAFVAV